MIVSALAVLARTRFLLIVIDGKFRFVHVLGVDVGELVRHMFITMVAIGMVAAMPCSGWTGHQDGNCQGRP